MEITPQIFTAQVMHHRLFPKNNSFKYNIYYLSVPLPAPIIPSFFQKLPYEDLGYCDGRCPSLWVRDILRDNYIDIEITDICLLTMPRVFGYVFNPISFYFCYDTSKNLRVVLCEVHNTFDEQHTYLCRHTDFRPIENNDCFIAEKLFHVSPFLERNGHYQFRFMLKNGTASVGINYFDENSNKQLITSLVGQFVPLNSKNLRTAFLKHPMVALKAIIFIHWQALKLLLKGLGYVSKPSAYGKKITVTENHTKI